MALWNWGRGKPKKEAGETAASRAPVEALRTGAWTCSKCEVAHGWPFDLAVAAPDPWPHDIEFESNSALDEAMNANEGQRRDFLSEDFCLLGSEHQLVRCVLPIPINGLDDQFGFGCWSSLSKASFEMYVDGFDAGDFSDSGPRDGWLCNRIERWVTDDPIGVDVYPQAGRQRPLLQVADVNHPLAEAQRCGISVERLIEMLRYYGHWDDT
jgi:hypothetical protein